MQTFGKEERLCSRKVIEHLFSGARSFKVYPFIVNWDEVSVNALSPLQVMFTVSSRQYRSAVERNRIRRLMREAYRKNKSPFLDFLNARQRACSVVVLFSGKEKLTAAEAESKIILILQRLQSRYEKASG